MNLWGIIKGLLVQEENDRTKQLSVEVDSGATTATRTTLKSAQTTDRTLNLPDADDTLVGKETTDLLKNKQLEDSSTEIVDSADNTKKIVLDAAGDTGTKTTVVSSQTSTDKTLTLPDATDTLMGKATTDTMTNKTVGDDLEIQGTTTSTSKDTGALVVQGGVGVEENLNVGGDTILTGDLTVNGTTTHVNSTNMDVTDKNITVNKDGNDASSEGAGLTVERTGTDGSIIYEDALTSKFKAGAVGSEVEIANVSGAQALTNKTVDGTSATGTNTVSADASDITLDPTPSTLTATTSQAGFNEVAGRLDSVETTANAAANKTLSNLTSPTAINQHVLPDGDGTRNLGGITQRWGNILAKDAVTVAGGGLVNNGTAAASGTSVNVLLQSATALGKVGISGIDNGAGSTGSAYIETGDSTGGNSGDINIQTGTASGTQGSIKLKDGSEGTIGEIWTSTGVNGEGNWAAAPATGANTTLSNLTSPTAVNQDIDPDGSGTRALGDVNKEWSTVRSRLLQATSGATVFGEMRTSTTSSASSTASVVAFRGVNIGSDTFFGSVEDTINVDANPTGDVLVESGRKTVGTGDSGNISLQTGTSAGGTQGSIKLKDGSEGTIGKIWTSKGTDGEGEWADATGSGGLNYITNPDAEIDLSDWYAYNDAPSPFPIDGTGAGSGIVIGSGGTAIRGTNCFSINHISARQGTGVGIDFAIDPADKHKTLYSYIDYLITDPDTDYVSGDYRIFIYDIDNAVLLGALKTDLDGDIPPAFAHLGEAKTIMGTFEATDSLNYKFLIHTATATAGTWSFKWDRVRVTSDSPVPGAIVTEWQSFTPTWSGLTLGNGSTEGYWRRVGDEMEVSGSLVWGSTTSLSGAIILGVPNSKTIDFNKIPTNITSSPEQVFGVVTALDSGTNFRIGHASANGPNQLIFMSDTAGGAWSNLAPFTWAINDELGFKAKFPIQGWSAGAIQSTTETLFSTSFIEGRGNAGTVLTANVTNIDWTETQDDQGLFDNVTFTAPKSGRYLVQGSIAATAGVTATIYTYINGTLDRAIDTQIASGIFHPHGEVVLSKGDALTVRTNVGFTLSNNTANHWLTVQELPDFSTFSVYGDSELIEAKSGADLAWPAISAQYGDVTSITVPPGEWDLSFNANWRYNTGSGLGVTDIAFGISTESGNSFTDRVNGDNAIPTTSGSTNFEMKTHSLPLFKVAPTVTTTYYLKVISGIVNASLVIRGYKISARRIK